MKPRTLILRTAGTNCDLETAHAFNLAGAFKRIHVNRFLRDGLRLDDFRSSPSPAGSVTATTSPPANPRQPDRTPSARCVARVCRSRPPGHRHLQWLPGAGQNRTAPRPSRRPHRSNLHTHQQYHRPIHRPLDRLKRAADAASGPATSRSIPPATSNSPLPTAKENSSPQPTRCQALWDNGQVALTYATANGPPANGQFPDNPNGSTDDIAGVCDASGLVFGLMPHPERFVDATQHPAWGSRPAGEGPA